METAVPVPLLIAVLAPLIWMPLLEITRSMKVRILAPALQVPLTFDAPGRFKQKVILANGPDPEVLTTTCETSSAKPSEVSPSVMTRSKRSTATPVVVAVEGRTNGSETALLVVCLPVACRATDSALAVAV